jgi:hypothetical protein
MSNTFEIDMRKKQQGVVVFPGDDMELYLLDDMSPADVRDYLTPLQRAVMACRLRYWADAIALPS